MKRLLLPGLFLLIAVGAYALYQVPEIRSLFGPMERPDDPLAFLEELPEVGPPPERPRRGVSPSPAARPVPDLPAAAPVVPQVGQEPLEPPTVDDETLARVLMQILAARGLSAGLSISASETEIILSGQVDSESRRNAIIDTVRQGRDGRRVNARNLKVDP